MCRNARRLASTSAVFSINLEYLGRQQLAVSGTFTGNLYLFSPVESVQRVDHRDAFYLLSSSLFGVAS